MPSSTSNSKPVPGSLAPLVLVLTVLLLGAYWGVVSLAGWNAPFAETNLNAGLLRMQSLAYSRGPTAVAVGTSITAKLRQDLIFEQIVVDSINMGIDGGSALFAARKVLESRSSPEIVLLEANLITKRPNRNMDTLQNAVSSVGFRMAESLPILRREYRPVTVLYSGLKLLKDEIHTDFVDDAEIDAINIRIEWPTQPAEFLAEEADMAKQWGGVIRMFKAAGVSVVLVMVPDSSNDRRRQYAFSRKLAAYHGLPFVDLKGQLANRGLGYSDGTHLVRRSAQVVSKKLNSVLLENDF